MTSLLSSDPSRPATTSAATAKQPHAVQKQPQKQKQLDVERITRAWRALMAYRGLSLQVFDTQALSFQALGEGQQALIPTVPIRLSHAAEAAEHNADLLERVAALTGIDARFDPVDFSNAELETTVQDFPDVVDTLLAIVRDWSAAGAAERARVYDPIVAAVQEAAEDAISTATASATLSSALHSRLSMHDYDLDHKHDRHLHEPQHGGGLNLPSFLSGGGGVQGEGKRDGKKTGAEENGHGDERVLRSNDDANENDLDASMHNFIQHESQLNESVANDVISNFCVLVVGASLGRLAWELARLGFSVQGVERSYLQLFTANFILNGLATPSDALHLYPFVHHTGLVSTADDQLREVQFPDTDPRQLHHADFSMVAGDFARLYHDASEWDCVVTCFSLENAPNVLTYVRRIAHVLKPGGVWVNHGSLDFRYDENNNHNSDDSDDNDNDNGNENGFEITQEELDFAIARCGLRVLRRESVECKPPYFVSGMVDELYQSIFFVAVKV